MAKQGMKRIDRTHTKPKNDVSPVPEIQGKAKSGKEEAKPIIPGGTSSAQKVYHTRPHSKENPISTAYAGVDTDLARYNLENHIPSADLEDL